MENWKIILNNLDDDYLIGMANKGIVKRAYKDMEAGDYKVISVDGEVEVSVGGEKVLIRQPLGESSCSCPSRTICRHVVLGILALKKFVAESGTEQEEQKEKEEKDGEIDEKVAIKEENLEKKLSEESLEGNKTDEKLKEESLKENKTNKKHKKENSEENVTEEKLSQVEKTPERQDLKSQLLMEISAFPFASLKKVLGAKQLLAIASQKKSGQSPKITYSSIITVALPRGGNTVKLLSPLEYSTCSCHKKEFCVHKAAAVLWCKLEAGEISEEDLCGTEELQDFSLGEIRDVSGQIGEFLKELLDTGLARISPDVLDYLDRLALISHNAKLANFEGYLRAIHDSYGNYLKRKASFEIKKLMEQFARLCKRVELLTRASDAKDAVQIAALAGEFRSEYVPIGNLCLMGIAMEHFESQTGYEGETVYFLEENTKQWYTYTSARPVFYDTTRRRGRQEKAAAPWGLPVSVEEMVGLRLHLSGARCDIRGRLSASEETRGEVIGNCQKENLHTGDLSGWYYKDFGKLFVEQIGIRKNSWLKEMQEERRNGELVFLRPYSFTRGEFSQMEQKLVMWLYDRAGREIMLELAYSKREEWGIGYLERLTEDKEPCFLGKLYFRDGRMCLYPVTVFEKGEWVEDLSGDGEEISAKKEDTGIVAEKEGREENNVRLRFDALSQVLADAGNLLEELYQSGLDTVHDSTLEGLSRMGKLAGQYGLSRLAEMFARLSDGAAMRRHRMERKTDDLMGIYAKACEYLYLCREKVEIDRGREYYNG